jgi:hypothetical protein
VRPAHLAARWLPLRWRLAGLAALAVCLGAWLCAGPAAAAQLAREPPPAAATPTPTATSTATPTPAATTSLLPAGPPPGERNPVQGAVAVIAIVVAAGAGFFIYRVIRNGL